jgi:uncharacterized protein YdaT
MPWSEDHHPSSMLDLSAVARAKAIESANALLAEGMDEGQAIRIAMARAEPWSWWRGQAPRAVG